MPSEQSLVLSFGEVEIRIHQSDEEEIEVTVRHNDTIRVNVQVTSIGVASVAVVDDVSLYNIDASVEIRGRCEVKP